MSSDNIFKSISRAEYRINSSNLFKDRSSPFSRPYAKPKNKKNEDLLPNAIYDVDPGGELESLTGLRAMLDKIIMFILTLLGKQKEWQEARTRLLMLQKRINTFETIIKEAKGQHSVSENIKHYRV
jgi:hypothetical protein